MRNSMRETPFQSSASRTGVLITSLIPAINRWAIFKRPLRGLSSRLRRTNIMTRYRRFRFLPTASCLLPTVLLLLTAHCSLLTVGAQSSTATLSGTVTDPNNAVVPGAHVTATNNGTGLKREATTMGSGAFTIPLLPPSTYTMLVENQGFTPAEIKDVTLNVGDNVALNIQ